MDIKFELFTITYFPTNTISNRKKYSLYYVCANTFHSVNESCIKGMMSDKKRQIMCNLIFLTRNIHRYIIQ